ncbi:MAG: acetyltransferase [Actinobacteria bacterium]|nr:acetyltransferase [Actinomycetota bacterium]
MKKSKKLIIFGDSAFAEIAYEYFEADSPYEVVAFTVSKKYLKDKKYHGLPVVPFENIESLYNPKKFEMHIALTYDTLNRTRKKFYMKAKTKGYKLANYISTKAFVWRNVDMGDNVFIFEDNTIQPFVSIGSNVVLWSGNHIGHHSKIGSHIFIASHVVVSGFCEIGDYTFLGVNSTIINNIKIGRDCLIGAGAMIVKNIENGKLLKGLASKPDEISVYEKFNLKTNEMD